MHISAGKQVSKRLIFGICLLHYVWPKMMLTKSVYTHVLACVGNLLYFLAYTQVIFDRFSTAGVSTYG